MDARLAAMTDALEHHFRQVAATAMADVPIVNPSLGVQAVGFHASEHGWLGVLITPWFINLVLLPQDSDWQALSMGSRQSHGFASGRYDFLIAEADGIGRYQSCSLLSPVLEIADQETAVQVALAALHALDKAQFRDGGTVSAVAADGRSADNGAGQAKPRLNKEPLSRRDFFRGRFLAGGETAKE